MNIIEQMLNKYNPQSQTEFLNAIKEVFQEITLLGLYRGSFFEKTTFYGGTSLRILYNLERFSEDLDFSLLEKNKNFNVEKHLDEFETRGIEVSLNKKIKQSNSNIKSAFLKSNTSIHTLNFQANTLKNLHNIKIKLEIDTNPPLKFQTEIKTILMPITFNISSMTLPNLYAGKIV